MMNKMKMRVDLKKGYDKLSTEEHAEVVMMCLSKLCCKAEELKELYTQLIKTYGTEMGLCDISMVIQVSSAATNYVPCSYTLGTKEGIKHAIVSLVDMVTKQVADIEKEESNDKE